MKTKNYRGLIWMRWAGRSISLLSGSLFTAIMIGIIGQDMSIGGFPASDFEGWIPLILGILAVSLLVAAIIAWRREGLGATILVVNALALGTFVYCTARINKLISALIYGIPSLVSGLLLLTCWRRCDQRRSFEGTG